MKKPVIALVLLPLGAALTACSTSAPTISPAGTSTSSPATTSATTSATSGTTSSSAPSTTGTSATGGTSGAAPTTTAITAGSTATCQPVTEGEIAALFQRWNDDAASGDPDRVVENYAPDSILVPTVSNQVRTTAAAKRDYFVHFLANKPSGVINVSDITLGCNMAVDSGLYTFTYRATGKTVPARYTFTYHWENGQWLIVSHHSSGMPEPAATSGPAASTTSAH
ncbi:MAG: SgcJ/EcaC family oxidoreductase [Austwickia sp.]|nr:MAG: SgcJ/EcaC family oxidoreductase [Austwickia sp.]